MELFDAIILWIHLVAAVLFVGPQVFLAAVAIPSLQTLEDVPARRALSRRITRGFGVLGGGALAVLVLTGFYNYAQASDDGLLDLKRYFWVLNIKLLLVVVVVILTGLHAMVFGRRLQELQESNASEAEIARVRQQSMIASVANLAASLAILLCAALLTSEWSRMGGLR